jgi:aminoglycoside phosphotransferase (APT) family kinase protein
MTLIDEAGGVRAGEELDGVRVDGFLKSVVSKLEGSPEIHQFSGGASNLTYLVRYSNRELILRRPPFGHKAKSAHDMTREAKFMTALKPVYPYVPTVVALCEDQEILGCDFYVMDRIRGIIPRQDFPPSLHLDPSQTRALCLSVIDKMIELHKVEPSLAGLDSFGKGQGYVKRQVEGWTDRYRKARTDNAASFETVMAWLHEKQPTHDIGTCVIHNDFRFDNVVLSPDSLDVIGVLDWEMATLGDPLADLGNTLAYWVQENDDDVFKKLRRQPTHLPGMLTRQEVIGYYGEKTGTRVDNFQFYAVYGLFRLAVIVQQIYYRFHHGQTKNREFASFVYVTHILEKRCLRMLDGTLV